MKPATAAVLRLLQERGARGLTPLEALAEAGTFRLSGRILEIRRAGYVVATEWERSPFTGARFARYVLHEEVAA